MINYLIDKGTEIFTKADKQYIEMCKDIINDMNFKTEAVKNTKTFWEYYGPKIDKCIVCPTEKLYMKLNDLPIETLSNDELNNLLGEKMGELFDVITMVGVESLQGLSKVMELVRMYYCGF